MIVTLPPTDISSTDPSVANLTVTIASLIDPLSVDPTAETVVTEVFTDTTVVTDTNVTADATLAIEDPPVFSLFNWGNWGEVA